VTEVGVFGPSFSAMPRATPRPNATPTVTTSSAASATRLARDRRGRRDTLPNG